MRFSVQALLPLVVLLPISFGISDCSDEDQDGDGWTVSDGDCNDSNAEIHPGAEEVCDWIDNDCDDFTDEEDPGLDTSVLVTYYADLDDDGYGDDSTAEDLCFSPGADYVEIGGDCDDTNDTVYLDAEEVCDLLDNDCDDEVDEGVETTFYFDMDADGYGVTEMSTYACELLEGYSELDGDCDDADDTIYPGADEYCNGIDMDCDGEGDDFDAVDADTWCEDSDGDGFGATDSCQTSCSPITGFVSNALDCEDSVFWVNPNASEICLDGYDNDCDGTANGCLFSGIYNLVDSESRIYGSRLEDTAGFSVTSAGDMNGDGYDDILVGAPGVDGRFTGETGIKFGAAFLIYGPPGATVDLANADAIFVGEGKEHRAGVSVAPAGDVNGDGVQDVIIGVPGSNYNGEQAGAAYLLYGPFEGTIDLGTADAIFLGEAAGDAAGSSVASAGDINEDGYDDLIIGAPGNDFGGSAAGAAYLINGPIYGYYDLYYANVAFFGEAQGAAAGISVASAGDCNGDGYRDLLVGAPDAYATGSATGSAYVIYGPEPMMMSLADADAKLTGEATLDEAGWSVAGAGDLNFDGIEDVLIGAPGAYSAYVLHGPLSGELSLASANAKFAGNLNAAGWSVASAGDVDQDGEIDLLIGAPLGETSGEETGKVYFAAGPFSGEVDLSSTALKLTGSRGDAAGYSVAAGGDLNGDGVPDVLVGAPGNDLGGDSGGAAFAVYGPIAEDQTLAESDGRLYGSGGGSYELGISVSGGGDINGDGYRDVILGAPNDDGAGTKAGATYVFYGPLSGSLEYTSADVRLVGEGPYQSSGRSVAGVGDVNADGYDDIVIGSPFYYGTDAAVTGAAYLVYGPTPSRLVLTLADARFTGEVEGDMAGQSVAAAGDVNADGYADFLVGAPYHDADGLVVGAAYLIYGPVEAGASLTDADARIIGASDGAFLGQSVAGAGDVNGDGYDDVLTGATGAGGGKGKVYLFYGPLSGNYASADADASLEGESEGDFAGRAISSAGDMNGDGYADILIGATADSTGGGGAGAVYVMSGPLYGDASLAYATAKFGGEGGDDLAGRSVASGGDVNGDGYDDLVVGAPGEDSNGADAGAAYVIYGPVSGEDSVKSSEVKWYGENESDLAGWSVRSGGDLDGDGLPDILIGAKGNDNGGSDAGAVYVVSTDAR